MKSIMALHDDQADKQWVSRWAGGDWKIGLLTGLSGQISQDVSLASLLASELKRKAQSPLLC